MTETTTDAKPRRTTEEIRANKLDTAVKAVGVAVKAHERSTGEAQDIALRAAASATRVSATGARVTAAVEAYRLAYLMKNGEQPADNDPVIASAQVGGSKTDAETPEGEPESEPADDASEAPRDPFAE